MNQICATKIWRIKHFWEFRHFLRKPDRCPACLISFRAAAASGAPQRRAAHVFQWESDRSRTTCESSFKRGISTWTQHQLPYRHCCRWCLLMTTANGQICLRHGHVTAGGTRGVSAGSDDAISIPVICCLAFAIRISIMPKLVDVSKWLSCFDQEASQRMRTFGKHGAWRTLDVQLKRNFILDRAV